VILTFNPFKQKRSRRWWVVSILAHVAIIFVLAQVMFRFPVGQLLGLPKTRVQPERITFVEVQKPAAGSVTTKAATPQPAAPATASARAPPAAAGRGSA
jgi:hypothetical protein